MLKLTMLLGLAALLGCGPVVPGEYLPVVGDILFQSLPRSPLIDTIEGSTGSPYSHCGILMESDGKLVVLEALHSVRQTPLAVWLAQGRQGAFSVYRLRSDLEGRIPDVIAAALEYKGRPYDIHYSVDDDAIYCSELIFKAFRTATGGDLGQVVTLGDLNWRPFEAAIRQVEGGPPPLGREMITPAALSRADQLEEVLTYGW